MRLPRSWYPLCGSAAVGRGRVLGVEAFAGRLAVFRAADGSVGVLDARCGHVGADLARGDVVGGALRCPLHGRRFAADGRRVDGAGCVQPALPAVERFGLVFAWLGGEPTFPLPEPRDVGVGVLTRPWIATRPIEMGCIGANAFDTAHLAHVHGRVLADEPRVEAAPHPACIRLRLRLDVAGGRWRDRLLRALGHDGVAIDTDCWGGNLLIFHHRRVGTFTVHAALPRDAGRTTVFTVSGRAAPASGPGRWREALRLRAHHRAALSFVADDERAVSGMRMRIGELDVDDASLAAWLAHFAALPRVEAWR